jgi:hypothetical protein
MVTQEEIKRSHTQGFGGSDAKMFAKIGRYGVDALSTTEVKRVLMVLGKMEYQSFGGNVYTEAGHMFEDWLAEKETDQGVVFDRETMMETDSITPRHFKVFAHADFYKTTKQEVVECKYSQDDTDKVFADYYEQLQWYYMLGAKEVHLAHGWGKVFPFEVEDWSTQMVQKDAELVETLTDGIVLLDEAIDKGYFDSVTVDELSVAELSKEQQEAAAVLVSAMLEVKRIEAEAEQARKMLTEAMERRGVVSIEGEGFKITYIAPTTRRSFDTKKAQEKYPDLKGDAYYKTSSVKSSIKITTR